MSQDQTLKWLETDIPFYRQIASRRERDVVREEKPEEGYLQVKPVLPK